MALAWSWWENKHAIHHSGRLIYIRTGIYLFWTNPYQWNWPKNKITVVISAVFSTSCCGQTLILFISNKISLYSLDLLLLKFPEHRYSNWTRFNEKLCFLPVTSVLYGACDGCWQKSSVNVGTWTWRPTLMCLRATVAQLLPHEQTSCEQMTPSTNSFFVLKRAAMQHSSSSDIIVTWTAS